MTFNPNLLLKKWLALLLAVCYHLAIGQIQLTHVVSNSVDLSSYPDEYFEFNNELFFLATEKRTGREIWKTDGTPVGTQLLKDINMGPEGSEPTNFVVFKNKLYFAATDGINGWQFWTSDGTTEGTIKVTNDLTINNLFLTFETPDNNESIVATDNFIYFFAKKSSYVLEVWRFDGLDITLVKGDIPIWNTPENLTTLGELVFFSAQPEGSNNTKVWRTDGTDEGTFPITDELDGNGSSPSGSSHPTQFIAYNDELYLIARSYAKFPTASVGIVKTDGTVEGTEYMMGIHQGNTDLIDFGEAIVHNGKLFFSFYTFNNFRYFIWETEGTVATTKKIYDYSSASYFTPSSIGSMGDNLYFTSGNTDGETCLVQHNTETGDNIFIKNLGQVPAPNNFFLSFYYASKTIVPNSSQIFLRLQKTEQEAEIWMSNGTPTGTLKLVNSSPFKSTYRMYNLSYYKDDLYFSGLDGEMWKSDGTLDGTNLFKDINLATPGITLGESITPVNNTLAIFAANGEFVNTELWVTDGTESGTKLLKELRSGLVGSLPRNFIPTENKVFFIANPERFQTEVFISDGTVAGTYAITSFSTAASVTSLTLLSDNLFMIVAKKADNTYSLYTMDRFGTTAEIKNFGRDVNNIPLNVSQSVMANNTFYALVSNQLWKSNGTVDGTTKIKDFYNVYQLVSSANKVYFKSKESAEGDWFITISDGTSEGTRQLVKLDGGNLIGYQGKALFVHYDPDFGYEPWVVEEDGTARMLKDIYPGQSNGVSYPKITMHNHNGKVYFTATSPDTGNELWKTDGTPEGTLLVKDIAILGESSKPKNVISLQSKLYFSAHTPDNGYEIWSYDDKLNEANLFKDVIPGNTSSNPFGFQLLNGQLLFFAESQSDGIQLFTLGNGKPPEPIPEPPEIITGVEHDERLPVVYPNPASDIITILPGKWRGGLFVIYDNIGRVVSSSIIDSNELRLSMSNYPSGIYLLQLVKDNAFWTKKLIIR